MAKKKKKTPFTYLRDLSGHASELTFSPDKNQNLLQYPTIKMYLMVLLTVCVGKQFSVSSLTLREKKSESREGTAFYTKRGTCLTRVKQQH